MWTSIPKPSAGNYTNVNPVAKTQYDDSTVTYDSVSVFYDGGDPNAWNDVSKPGAGAWINVAKPI